MNSVGLASPTPLRYAIAQFANDKTARRNVVRETASP
jgi:hypothetical protein